ncbi:DUF1674 domain-containing protein [Candidatus Liberibacter americanus]|uniref:DUF1674 domain-containing protein n=1 Tax=Candidatus Liberibacter americanus str. Sao Paulo TaxID=1261131 RepID=U6B6P5_9HYPH|nr:DUF1674 domain-containing protein [Candidatus Liberibacter americanus]AHA27417.1 hypothetical protein lam_033 [Candidatus Liberibacter americanus str. Sao Paulo]EMS36690.1 hypothetical protein G653_00545 [Candidatus Liberibacter americanus PW_SP]
MSNHIEKNISSIAKRALEEAERRRSLAKNNALKSKEIGGIEGPEPTRFGDWEKNGLSIDF